MGGPRSQATKADILAAFATDVPFKAYAAQIGMSPNTLRGIWKGAFGDAAFAERGKRLQAAAASQTCVSMAGTRKYGVTSVTCTSCKQPVQMQTNQAAQVDPVAFLCDACKYDRACPVCALPVDGERGLAGHFRHRKEAGDIAHIAYAATAPWEGKREGQDYVTCLVCLHRAPSLGRHLKAEHGMTAEEYRAKYANAPVWSATAANNHRTAVAEGRKSAGYLGAKAVTCPSCGQAWQASKFLASMHDHRCADCQQQAVLEADQARWEGKSEPVDYVECRVCGWRGENITGHFQSTHPDRTLQEYRLEHPDAPWFISTAYQFQPSANKANLTESDLAPFKDDKGRVTVAQAADALGVTGQTILRYCKQLGIPTRNRLAFQKQVLDAVASLLGESYDWEWKDERIINPATGYYLFYDGYFAAHNLLVEAHGKQHFTFIPHWHKTEAYYQQMVERDEIKLRRAVEQGYKLLVLRYDEPYSDADYLRRRLVALGIL